MFPNCMLLFEREGDLPPVDTPFYVKQMQTENHQKPKMAQHTPSGDSKGRPDGAMARRFLAGPQFGTPVVCLISRSSLFD